MWGILYNTARYQTDFPKKEKAKIKMIAHS